MLEYLMLILGFVLLIKGADFFVDGSSSIAKLLKVPSLIIGLTIVAMGTSAPEASVSITAAINGNNGIALGNVVGSNIFNLLVVIGFCGLIKPVNVDKAILRRDYTYSIIITIVTGILMFIGNSVGRIDGAILLAFFAFFLYYTINFAIKNRTDDVTEESEKKSPIISCIYIIGGLIGIIAGGNMVVSSASNIAKYFGLSDSFIGLTIVAFGTSLPELVTSIVAAKKGESGIALGNVVGSNIFNLIFILGLSALIHPIAVDVFAIYDLLYLLVVSLLVWWLAGNDGKISKKEAGIMVGLYIAYTIYLILR